ncbi:DUF4419 domain-containing protein [Niabella terrae]
MMRQAISVLLLCWLTFPTAAQQSFKFTIENLKAPDFLLPEYTGNEIFNSLMAIDAGYTTRKQPPADFNPLPDLVARSSTDHSLVHYGYHSFFDGMYHAYAEHRPFTLSPDMIWLLILQGFSQHVNAHAETLRPRLVSHKGKITLVVRNDKIRLDDPASPWEEVFPEFTRQINDNTVGQQLGPLVADFSTTTPATRMAAEITLMDAMKKYFEYLVLIVGCGIPSITLEGSPADWKSVLARTQSLKKYDLGWWTDELEPILQEFINAAEKKVNIHFWQQMFKYHEAGGFYKSKSIDGWIVKFFPYDRDGRCNNLDSLSGSWNLPPEICKVDLKHQKLNPDGSIVTTPLELWAGFMGLHQDRKDYTLRPRIGWIIRKADPVNARVVKELASMDAIQLRVAEVPPEILALKKIKKLVLYFTGEVRIPDGLRDIQIEELQIRGSIKDAEALRITRMLPDTQVIINLKNYRNGQTPISAGW